MSGENITVESLEGVSREQWLAMRRTGISGTDVAAILGQSPWANPIDVFLDKTGAAEMKTESIAMKVGNALEPMIADHYSETTSLHLIQPGFLRRADLSWMVANPDRIAILPSDIGNHKLGWGHVLEIKTARGRGTEWGEPGTDDIPTQYLMQVAWYLAVADLAFADVSVYFKGSDKIEEYRIHRDTSLEAIMIDRADTFWRKHILTGIAPPVDGSDRCAEWIARRHPRNVEPLRVGTFEEIEIGMRLAKAIAASKATEAEVEECKNLLKQAIGDSEGIDLGEIGKITWKNTKGSAKTDWKGIAQALNVPDSIIAQHTTTNPGSRRFLPSLKGLDIA
jgi:putative phage-type endonuclease